MIFFLLNILFSSPAVFAADQSSLLSPATTDILPAFLLDHVGFQVPADETFAIDGIDPLEPIFPLFSASKHGKSVGLAVIPKEYLGTQDRLNAAQRQLQQTGYLTHYFQNSGALAGADPSEWEVDENHSYTESVGVTISLDPSGLVHLFQKKKKKITDSETHSYGLTLSLAEPAYTFGADTQWLNLDPFRAFQTGNIYARYLKHTDIKSVSASTLKNSEYLKLYLALNAQSRTGLPVIRAKQEAELSADSFALPLNPSPLSPRMQATLKALQSHLEDEQVWRDRVSDEVGQTLIVSNADDEGFIQKACSTLAEALSMPADLWPHCRIAASGIPAAYAFPGGDLFVTAGLLAQVQHLDTLYFVLGHQLAHVIARQTTREMPEWSDLSVPSAVLGIVGHAFALPPMQRLNAGLSFTDWFPAGWEPQTRLTRIRQFGESLLTESLVSMLLMHSDAAQLEAEALGDEAALRVGADPMALSEDRARLKQALSAVGSHDFFAELPTTPRFAAPSKGSALPHDARDQYSAMQIRYQDFEKTYFNQILSGSLNSYALLAEYQDRTFSCPAGRGLLYSLRGAE